MLYFCGLKNEYHLQLFDHYFQMHLIPICHQNFLGTSLRKKDQS